MTDSTHPERRYRRLLACYPQAFREEHEDEMLVRVLMLALFALTTVSLLSAFAQHATTYAATDLAAGSVLWLLGLVTVLLIFNPHSDQHHGRCPATARPSDSRAMAGWSAPER
jgi:hypothetical protein